MKSRIYDSTYKDVGAVALEDDTVRVLVVPGYGAKVASILYKPMDRELLWQVPGREYKRPRYGDPYVPFECSGFDDMFPSINRCYYPRYPWAGAEIPDHGEVWSVPWASDKTRDGARFRVHGVRLPYTLEKTISLENGSISIEYRASNPSPFEMDYIWAAHPLFQASPGMELVVPDGMDEVVNAYPGPLLENYGARYGYPLAAGANGNTVDIGRMPRENSDAYAKYYFCGRVPQGWCILYDPSARLNIGISFPPDRVPYLGVWMHAGGLLEGHYNFAPEPATAAMDAIDASSAWGAGSVLKPGAAHEWRLTFSFREGGRAGGVLENGTVR